MLPKTLKTSLRRLKRRLRKVDRSGPQWGQDGFLYAWVNERLEEMSDDGLRRPYAWGILQAACLAAAVGIERVSVAEFGVAGGRGLVSMEEIAARVERLVNVRIEVYGFDSGVGLPAPTDIRDVPNLFSSGLYPMDQQKLRSRLQRSQLLLGDVKDTVGEFLAAPRAPLAFIACDLDLYTSTVQALRILDCELSASLPRVHCYFDDVLGFTYSDHNGERLAIHEFNSAHGTRKISPIYGLKYYVPSSCFNDMWVDKFWIAHLFEHPAYTKRDSLVRGHNLELPGA